MTAHRAINNTAVRIVRLRTSAGDWFQVWVRGVLACEAPSEHGARECARNYIRKLARL
jgi:hypothetical protein